jgi:FtsH-binding integral membrane protein
MSDQQPPYEPYQPYPEDSARQEHEAQLQAASMERPPSIVNAVRLMWVGAGLAALYLVISLIMLGSLKDDIRDELRRQGEEITQSKVDTAFNVAVISFIVFGLLGIALWAWMALMNSQGKRWARILATVLGALNIVINLLSLLGASAGTDTNAIGTTFTILNLIVAIAALVFMYRKDASAYYAAMSRRPA